MAILKYNWFLILLLSLLLWACRKNDRLLSLKPINEISISSVDSVFEVAQLDTLRIPTQLKMSVDEKHTFNYEWKVLNTGPNQSIVISRQKNLDTAIALSPGSYTMIYKVTDEITGISAFKQYQLTVNGAFYEGWLVIGNRNGSGMLSFIRTDNILFLNPAETINRVNYTGKALAAYAGVDAVYNPLEQLIYFTDKGAYRFDANTFVQNGTTKDLFPNGREFGNKPYYAISGNSTDQYIIDNGAIYGALGPLFFSGGELGTFSERFPGDYYLFPYVITSTGQYSCYFYDNKNKKFYLSSYLTRELKPAAGNNPKSFNMANVGKEMIACDYSVGNEYYCVMKDENGFYMYSVTPNKSPYAGISQPFSNSPGLENATSFAASTLYKHVYYGTGNKIYLYDVLANVSRLIYEFPVGYQVKVIKMHKGPLRSFPSNPSDGMKNKRLVVGVNNGAEGEVYYFDLNTLGNFVNDTYNRKFTGFGEIIQMDFRNK